MTPQEYFKKYEDKYIDYDKFFGNQCTDNYRQYCKEVLQIPQSPPVKGAADIWDTYLKECFIRIPNTPLGVPKQGDILVWSRQLNGFGHTAICQSANLWNFVSFDQNFPIGSVCHFQKHSYKYLLGWLRPAKQPFKIAFVNGELAQINEFLAKVGFYTNSAFSCVWERFGVPISVPSGTLTTEQAMKVIDGLKTDAKAFFIFYLPNPDSAYEVASYHPARNAAFATIPMGCPTTILVHAFLHILRKFINFNHMKPYVEDVEKYPTSWADAANFNNEGWKFQEQYTELQPYFNKL